MRKLRVDPEQDGYSLGHGPGALTAVLDGGQGAYRADYVGAASRLSLSWVLDPAEYRYMRAFYRTGTAMGSEPFLIDLIHDSGVVSEHTAKFIPGTMELTAVLADAFRVRASIEARPRENA